MGARHVVAGTACLAVLLGCALDTESRVEQSPTSRTPASATTARMPASPTLPAVTEPPSLTTALPPAQPPPAPATPPPAPAAPAPAPAPSCHPSYIPCLPIVSDVDCAGGSGNGPVYTGRVQVIGPDEYELDRDRDGIGCE